MEEKRVIRIIEKIMPSVVSIVISKHLEDLEKEMPPEMYPFLPVDPHTKHLTIPDEFVDAEGLVQIGGGSGFVVEKNGLVLTNKHVVFDKVAEYSVLTNDGKKYKAQILSRDPINDVAIIKIEAGNLPVVSMGNASKLKLGQSVIAIGNALGIFRNTVSVGIVSGLSRSITAQADPKSAPQELRGLIQTDAAINPGNSGGPLVDSDGRVVGINAAIISGAQNIGLAIPINAAERDFDDICRFGRIRRPFLGLRYIIIDEKIRKKMKLGVDHGAIVVRETPHDRGVIKGSPAEKADLREKDIVLSLDGKKIDADHPIQDFLENLAVGDSVKLTVLRNGQTFESSLVLTERV